MPLRFLSVFVWRLTLIFDVVGLHLNFHKWLFLKTLFWVWLLLLGLNSIEHLQSYEKLHLGEIWRNFLQYVIFYNMGLSRILNLLVAGNQFYDLSDSYTIKLGKNWREKSSIGFGWKFGAVYQLKAVFLINPCYAQYFTGNTVFYISGDCWLVGVINSRELLQFPDLVLHL